MSVFAALCAANTPYCDFPLPEEGGKGVGFSSTKEDYFAETARNDSTERWADGHPPLHNTRLMYDSFPASKW
jgi:hypothetical protein